MNQACFEEVNKLVTNLDDTDKLDQACLGLIKLANHIRNNSCKLVSSLIIFQRAVLGRATSQVSLELPLSVDSLLVSEACCDVCVLLLLLFVFLCYHSDSLHSTVHGPGPVWDDGSAHVHMWSRD